MECYVDEAKIEVDQLFAKGGVRGDESRGMPGVAIVRMRQWFISLW